MGIILGIAVALSVVWVVRLVVAEVARRDKAVRAREEAEDDVEQRVAHALQREGLTADNPLQVTSAAAIEPRAEAEPCPICDGPLHVQAHEVDDDGPVRLRRVELKCGDCGRPTTFYAEVQLPN